MSFILEALRRTDRERKSGINPNLQNVVEAPPTPPVRPRSPWLAAAAIVALGAGAAALVLWTRGARQPPPPVTTAAQPTPPTEPSKAPASAPPAALVTADETSSAAPLVRRPEPRAAEVAPPPTQPAQAQTSLTTAVQRRLERVKATREMPVQETDTPSVAAATVDEPVPPAIEEARPVPHSELDPVIKELEAEARALLAQNNENPAGPGEISPPATSTPEAIAPPPAPPAEVPWLESLPPAQRQPFEGIHLDAHVYADDPTDRFVLINMRGHRVGDRVGTDGPVLESITEEGAVLRSGATYVHIPHP